MDKRKFYISLTLVLFSCIMAGCTNSDSNNKIELSSSSYSLAETDIHEEIFVYVMGAVKSPGVYEVKNGSRVYEVIELAGGMKDNAQKDYLNLAEVVCDGQKIQVMTKKQFKKQYSLPVEGAEDEKINSNNGMEQQEKININSADVGQLTSLSGIGETKAAAIVAYRNENGNFSSIEDIKKVSGIGDATFANIASKITVD